MSSISIGVGEGVEMLMKNLVVGSMLKVKCRLGISLKDHHLSLSAEEIVLISSVKVVID